MKSKVLIIDDEKDICFLIAQILNDEKFITSTATNSDDALKKYNIFNPDLIILDVWLGTSKLDGIELLKKIKSFDPLIPIIIISGHGTVDMAVNAIKNGAYDFLEKPFNSDKITILSKRAIENLNLLKENYQLRKITSSDVTIIGKSNFINDLKKVLYKISVSSSRILITGPVGSGKKLIAQAIHKSSKKENSIANLIDFSTIEKNKLEEIFSIEKNINNNILLKSNNGTIIFQDIDKIPLEFQKQFLRLLENQEIFKKNNLEFNVKIISLTSKNLNEEIEKDNFRKDLFYRLNIVPINIPPIKYRRDDILPLFEYYINKYNKNKKYKFYFAKNAISKLESYDWPGNVRQIVNYSENIALLNQDKNTNNDFEISNLPLDMGESYIQDLNIMDNIDLTLKDAREEFEKKYFLSQIKRFNGNIAKVSNFTGMERTALYRKLKFLKIHIDKK